MLADILPEVSATAAALAEAGMRTASSMLDVRDRWAWDRVVAETIAAFGPVTILIYNAGITLNRDFEAVDIEDFQRILDVNLLGGFRGMQAVLPSMKGAGGGAIVNIASTTRTRSCRSRLLRASKAALANLTNSAALHCAEQR